MTYAQSLEQLRERVAAEVNNGGVTVSGLARLTGYSQPAMQNMITRRRGMSIAMADRLLRLFGWTLRDLVECADCGGGPDGGAGAGARGLRRWLVIEGAGGGLRLEHPGESIRSRRAA